MLAPENGVGSRGSRTDAVQKAASQGMASSGGALPYGAQIQRSFGGYDISNVQAHAGAAANDATSAMGAAAYASGNHVVLGEGGKDLHTVAHEAAHVVQQRQGVSLSGGVGQAGDPYEQHADAVADLVVQGKSAEGLLGQMAGGGAGGAGVQMRGGGRPEAPLPADDGVGSGRSGLSTEPLEGQQSHADDTPTESADKAPRFGRLTVPGTDARIEQLGADELKTCLSQPATKSDSVRAADSAALGTLVGALFDSQTAGIDFAEKAATEEAESTFLVDALVSLLAAGLTGGWSGILTTFAFSALANAKASAAGKSAAEEHRTMRSASGFVDGTKEFAKTLGKAGIDALKGLAKSSRVSKRDFFEAAREATRIEKTNAVLSATRLAPHIICAPDSEALTNALTRAAAEASHAGKDIAALRMASAWLQKATRESHGSKDGVDFSDMLGGGDRGVLNMKVVLGEPGAPVGIKSAEIEGVDYTILDKFQNVPIDELSVYMSIDGRFVAKPYTGYPNDELELALTPGGSLGAHGNDSAALLWLYHRLGGHKSFSFDGAASRARARAALPEAVAKFYREDLARRTLGKALKSER